MKLKTLLLFAVGIVWLMASKAMAGQPTFASQSNSTYIVSQTSMTVSSIPVQSSGGTVGGGRIGPVGGWREVRVQLFPTALQDGTSVFYSLTGSTNNIYAVGYVVRVSTLVQGVPPPTGQATFVPNEVVIESNAQINLMTAVGVPGVAARVIQKRLPQ